MLGKGIEDKSYLADFLDRDIQAGGLDMDSRTADNLSQQIKKIVEEIGVLRGLEDQMTHHYHGPEKLRQIRQYLIDTFNVGFDDFKLIDRLDSILIKRINNKISRVGLKKFLDKPYEKGGLGLNRRTAKKIARRFELLMLGSYKSAVKKDKENKKEIKSIHKIKQRAAVMQKGVISKIMRNRNKPQENNQDKNNQDNK